MERSSNVTDASFGIVPVHAPQPGADAGAARRFLLVQHHAGHWGFPKGHAEGDESPVEAAVRELAEETGLVTTRLLDDAPLVETYRFTVRGRLVHKTVTYFVGFVESDAVTPQAREVCDSAWGTYEQTMKRLTFRQGRSVLERAGAVLRGGC